MFKFTTFVTNLSKNLAPEVCAGDLYFWISPSFSLSVEQGVSKKKINKFVLSPTPRIQQLINQIETHKLQVLLV